MSKIELKQLSFAYDNQEALLFDYHRQISRWIPIGN